MAFFTGMLLIPFFPETFRQIGRFYDLHHGKTFITVEDDKELGELNTELPDGEEIFKYEVLRSVKPAELMDEIIPETIEYQRKLKQMWVDIGVSGAVQYDFDKEFEVHYMRTKIIITYLRTGKSLPILKRIRQCFLRSSTLTTIGRYCPVTERRNKWIFLLLKGI